MKRLGQILSALTGLLVAASVVIITGGLFDRPLLLAAVPTGSMYPALKPGDLIVVLPTWAMPALQVGDIVVYRTERDTTWIVHRIVDGDPAEGFVIKGDANQQADPGRVFARDVAGVVPQIRGGAARFPRAGLLSLNQGPLSSPVVAGIALIMGIFLLVLDLRPGGRARGLPVRRPLRVTSTGLVSLYLGLAATAFLSTLIPAWTLSSRTVVQYKVVAQRPVNVSLRNQYLVGEGHRETVTIRNPSPLPLAIVFGPEDPNLTYSPAATVIPPHGEAAFAVTLETPSAGKFESSLRMGVYLPILPLSWLRVMAQSSMALAAAVLSLIPFVAVMLIALLDHRSRTVFHRWRIRIMSWFAV